MSNSRYILRSRSHDERRALDDESSSEESSENSQHSQSPEPSVHEEEPEPSVHEEDLEMAAAYTNYNASTADRMSYVPWYNVRDLVSAVRSMQRINFSVVEKRAQALDTLNNVNDDVPYAADKRFPETGLYICAGKGDWARKIQQLRTSLSFKEPVKDARTPAGSTNDGNDASLAFYNACTAIMSQVAQGDYVYSQKKFEEEFGLNWA